MNSCTWRLSEAFSSFSGRNGRAISRTTTRWFPTPIHTWPLLKPPRFQSSRRASETARGSRTSPFSTAPGGKGPCAARTTVGCVPAESSAARTAVDPMSSPIRPRSRVNLPRPDVAPVSQVPHLPHRVHRSSGSPESRLTKHQGSGQVKHPEEMISAGRTPVRGRRTRSDADERPEVPVRDLGPPERGDDRPRGQVRPERDRRLPASADQQGDDGAHAPESDRCAGGDPDVPQAEGTEHQTDQRRQLHVAHPHPP